MSIIRSMTAEDAAKVASLEAAIFSQPWRRMLFWIRFVRPTRFLVAEESGVMGTSECIFAADEGEITNVVVNPACRRRGNRGRAAHREKNVPQTTRLPALSLKCACRMRGRSVCTRSRDFPRWVSAGGFMNSREKMPELWSVPCNSLWDCTAAQ